MSLDFILRERFMNWLPCLLCRQLVFEHWKGRTKRKLNQRKEWRLCTLQWFETEKTSVIKWTCSGLWLLNCSRMFWKQKKQGVGKKKENGYETRCFPNDIFEPSNPQTNSLPLSDRKFNDVRKMGTNIHQCIIEEQLLQTAKRNFENGVHDGKRVWRW